MMTEEQRELLRRGERNAIAQKERELHDKLAAEQRNNDHWLPVLIAARDLWLMWKESEYRPSGKPELDLMEAYDHAALLHPMTIAHPSPDQHDSPSDGDYRIFALALLARLSLDHGDDEDMDSDVAALFLAGESLFPDLTTTSVPYIDLISLEYDRKRLATYIGDIGYILEYARAMALGDPTGDGTMASAITEAIRIRKELTKENRDAKA